MPPPHPTFAPSFAVSASLRHTVRVCSLIKLPAARPRTRLPARSCTSAADNDARHATPRSRDHFMPSTPSTADADCDADDTATTLESGAVAAGADVGGGPGDGPENDDDDDEGTRVTVPLPSAGDYILASGEVGVRFINTRSGIDAVAAAQPGDNLLTVGDSVGIYIPRACQSGLCGSCTCDIVDSRAESGVQTVRACQTGVVIPDDGIELVVDVSRMKTPRKGPDPMARFENLDTQYVAGAAPRMQRGGTLVSERECAECAGSGETECYNCDGRGDEVVQGVTMECALCTGTCTLRCAFCQGTGTVSVSR